MLPLPNGGWLTTKSTQTHSSHLYLQLGPEREVTYCKYMCLQTSRWNLDLLYRDYFKQMRHSVSKTLFYSNDSISFCLRLCFITIEILFPAK